MTKNFGGADIFKHGENITEKIEDQIIKMTDVFSPDHNHPGFSLYVHTYTIFERI
jgi:hypothetical protein